MKYTSKREARPRPTCPGQARRQEAKLAKAELAEKKAELAGQKAELAREHVEACLAGEYPKWRLTVHELTMLKQAQRQARN